jgi:hypothetical protein
MQHLSGRSVAARVQDSGPHPWLSDCLCMPVTVIPKSSVAENIFLRFPGENMPEPTLYVF